MVNAVSADGLIPDCTQSWADAAWKCILYPELCHVLDA